MHDWSDIEAAYGRSLKRVVASYAPPGPAREELAQEVAVAVWRALPRFRGEASLRTYVLRVAHNVALRHTVRRRAIHTTGLGEEVDPGPSPEEAAVRQQRHEQLMWGIRQLPLGQRQALTLALEGLTHAEIGEILGLRENAVAVRLHRARAGLAQRLEAE